MISPLNQKYTENSLGHPSLKLGAWKTQLEERYKLKTDKALMDLVLKKKSGGYEKIEDRDNRLMGSRAEQKIPWETFSREFENRGANDLSDHW